MCSIVHIYKEWMIKSDCSVQSVCEGHGAGRTSCGASQWRRCETSKMALSDSAPKESQRSSSASSDRRWRTSASSESRVGSARLREVFGVLGPVQFIVSVHCQALVVLPHVHADPLGVQVSKFQKVANLKKCEKLWYLCCNFSKSRKCRKNQHSGKIDEGCVSVSKVEQHL